MVAGVPLVHRGLVGWPIVTVVVPLQTAVPWLRSSVSGPFRKRWSALAQPPWLAVALAPNVQVVAVLFSGQVMTGLQGSAVTPFSDICIWMVHCAPAPGQDPLDDCATTVQVAQSRTPPTSES